MSSDTGVSRVVIDALTNFGGTCVGLASVGNPLKEPAVARAAARAGGGNLELVARFNKKVAMQQAVGASSSVNVSMIGETGVNCAIASNSSKTECK